jgi:hypothetical protein
VLAALDATTCGLETGDTLAKAAAGLKRVDAFISGHGSTGHGRSARSRRFNRDFANAVRAGKPWCKAAREPLSGNAYKSP